MKHISLLFSYDESENSFRNYYREIPDLKVDLEITNVFFIMRKYGFLLQSFYNNLNRFTHTIVILIMH